MSAKNIELKDINLVIEETKEIKISENDIRTNDVKTLTKKTAKINFSTSSFFLKEAMLEIEFYKFFKMTTCDIEYKDGLSYKNVKLVLESNKLTVFDKNIEDSRLSILSPILVLNFDQITADVSVTSEMNKFSIYVLGCKKIFKFRTDKSQIYKTVLIYLNHFIKSSLGSRTNLLGVSLRKDFYKVFKFSNMTLIN